MNERCTSETKYTTLIFYDPNTASRREREEVVRCYRVEGHTGDHSAYIPTIGEWHWQNLPRMYAE